MFECNPYKCCSWVNMTYSWRHATRLLVLTRANPTWDIVRRKDTTHIFIFPRETFRSNYPTWIRVWGISRHPGDIPGRPSSILNFEGGSGPSIEVCGRNILKAPFSRRRTPREILGVMIFLLEKKIKNNGAGRRGEKAQVVCAALLSHLTALRLFPLFGFYFPTFYIRSKLPPGSLRRRRCSHYSNKNKTIRR